MKDFNLWNTEKQKIELRDSRIIQCHKRQIWLCAIGENIGAEISKSNPFVRPVLIVKLFFGGLVLVVPLTSQYKDFLKEYLLKIDSKKYGLNKDSYLMLNQFRIISKKRLIRQVNGVKKNKVLIPLFDNDKFQEILNKISSNFR